jgi:hypothetical protein
MNTPTPTTTKPARTTPHQPPQKRTAKAARTTPEQKPTPAYTFEQRHNPEHAPEQTHPLEHAPMSKHANDYTPEHRHSPKHEHTDHARSIQTTPAAHAQHPKEHWIEKKDNIKKRFPEVTDQDLSFGDGKREETFRKLHIKLGKTSEELHMIIAGL